jgi:hypothetical protein
VELVRAAVTAAPLPTTHDEHPLQVDPAHAEGSVTGGRVWRIGCRDVIDRERFLTVLVERNQLVLIGPPGETAVLTAGQIDQLRAALREAVEHTGKVM